MVTTKNETVNDTSDDEWQDVETEGQVKFDIDGDEFIGKLLGWSETDNGIAQAHFDSPNHGKVFINVGWDLKRQLKQVKVGTMCRITRIGVQDTGRDTPMVLFRVQTRK